MLTSSAAMTSSTVVMTSSLWDRPLQSLQSRLQSSFLGFRKLPPNVNKMCSNANFTSAQRQEGARIISLLSRGETEAQKKVA